MRPRLVITVALLLGALPPAPARAAAAVLIDQSFSPTSGDCIGSTALPSGWTQFDVDGLTPIDDPSFLGRAWEVRNDFTGGAGCVAVAASAHTSAGAANDFLCSPQVTLGAHSQLSWRAQSFDLDNPDAYEVRLLRGVPAGGTGDVGNLLSASAAVFSATPEAPSWTAHTLLLDALGYANETVAVCFRDTSTGGDRLLVDDVKLIDSAVNLQVQSPLPASEYTRVPVFLGYRLQRGATLRNAGALPLTGAYLAAEVLRDGNDVRMDATPLQPTLVAGAARTLSIAGSIPIDQAGVWRVDYLGLADQTGQDVAPEDDVASSATVTAGTYELARDSGTAGAAGLGIGLGGGELGQTFDLPNYAEVLAIRFVLGASGDPAWPGRTLRAHLRGIDLATGKPGPILATSVALVATAAGGTYTATFPSGNVNLPRGRYLASVDEPAGLPYSPIPLLQSPGRFVAGTTWVNWAGIPGGDWRHPEELRPSAARPFLISLLLVPDSGAVFADGFD